MNRYVGRILDERFSQSTTKAASKKERDRSVMSLALETYNKEFRGDAEQSGKMSPQFRQYAIDQMKTFLFAGHDTTSSTICYIYHKLRKNPAVLDKVCAEHDAVFGTDITAAPEMLVSNPYLLNKLEYSNAVIKEVLRMYSPASSVRVGDKNLGIYDPSTGTSYPTEGCMIWIISAMSQRNSSHWDDPKVFRPERFLGADAASIPKDSWRPFEKGPRSCIGQELAFLETKVVMVLGLREFQITTAYDEVEKLRGDGLGWGKDVGGKGTFENEEAYQILRATAKPRQGMPCRVSMRTQTEV